jgi:hypothetical protein
VALAVANGVTYALAIHRATLPSRSFWSASLVIVLLLTCGTLLLSIGTLGSTPPPWGCPTLSTQSVAAGPPWGCISTLQNPGSSNLFFESSAGPFLHPPYGLFYMAWVRTVCAVPAPPLVALILLFLAALALMAGSRDDFTILDGLRPPRVYPPSIVALYGQPLFWGLLAKVCFFCFGANIGGELLNLRSCDRVDLWQWEACHAPHDIVLDLGGTSFGVGFFVTVFNFPEICAKGVMRGRVNPVDEAILGRWFLRPWPTGRRTPLLRQVDSIFRGSICVECLNVGCMTLGALGRGQFVLLRAIAMGLATTLFIGSSPAIFQNRKTIFLPLKILRPL